MADEPHPAEIINHRLTWARWKASPNHGGILSSPSLLLLHTSSLEFELELAALCSIQANLPPIDRNRRSANLVIGKSGEVVQLVPFNRVAWHAAARAEWNGRRDLNFFSIGIVLETPGWRLRDRRPVEWASYSAAQLASLDRAARALCASYPTITAAASNHDTLHQHSDAAPEFGIINFNRRIFFGKEA